MNPAAPRRRISFVIAVATAAIVLAACGGGDDDGAAAAADTETTAGTDAESVSIRLVAFMPEELTIDAGQTVTWVQEDAGRHTVTSGTVETAATGSATPSPDGTFASGDLATDEEFSFAFEEAGTYSYFCELHPATMRGEITVK